MRYYANQQKLILTITFLLITLSGIVNAGGVMYRAQYDVYSGTGDSQEAACISLASTLSTAFGSSISFSGVVSSQSDVTDPCGDGEWLYTSYPACLFWSESSCTDAGGVSIVPIDRPEEFCPMLGNPIDPSTGNKHQQETDIIVITSRGNPFVFDRFYNSLFNTGISRDGSLGQHWRSSFDRSIDVAESYTDNPAVFGVVKSAVLHRHTGWRIPFVYNDGNWSSPGRNQLRLSETTTGFEFVDENDVLETYDSNGRLLSIQYINGFTLTLTYAGNNLDRVDTDTGEYFTISYDASNRIDRVIDHTNRSWVFRYDSNNNLKFVDNPDGTTRQYHYEDLSFPNALTGITDERNIRFSTYSYDGQGRAQQSSLANNVNSVSISYDSATSRTITNSRNSSTTYNLLIQSGHSIISDISGPGCASCGNSDSSYEYDTNNNISSRTVKGVRT